MTDALPLPASHAAIASKYSRGGLGRFKRTCSASRSDSGSTTCRSGWMPRGFVGSALCSKFWCEGV